MVPASGRVGWTNLFAQRKNSKKFPSSHNCIFSFPTTSTTINHHPTSSS